jgi:hypothetical protein
VRLEQVGTLGPPHGSEPTREAIRDRQVEEARRFGWPQLDRADLIFDGRGIVEHRPSGTFYVLHRGQLDDLIYAGAVAFFEDASGTIRFLEAPPAGFPKDVAELKRRRAERERRRQATSR